MTLMELFGCQQHKPKYVLVFPHEISVPHPFRVCRPDHSYMDQMHQEFLLDILSVYRTLDCSLLPYSGLFSRGVNFPEFPELTRDSGKFYSGLLTALKGYVCGIEDIRNFGAGACKAIISRSTLDYYLFLYSYNSSFAGLQGPIKLPSTTANGS